MLYYHALHHPSGIKLHGKKHPDGLILLSCAKCCFLRFYVGKKVLFRKAHILHEFHRSKICALCIPHGHVSNQHGLSVFLHPDWHFIERSIPELSDDAPHLLLDFRRVTGKYLAVDCHARTLEIFRSFIKKPVDIIRIFPKEVSSNQKC